MELYTKEYNEKETSESNSKLNTKEDAGHALSIIATPIYIIECIACGFFVLAGIVTEYIGVSLIALGSLAIVTLFYFVTLSIAQIATNSKTIVEALDNYKKENTQYIIQQRNILLDIRKELQNKE